MGFLIHLVIKTINLTTDSLRASIQIPTLEKNVLLFKHSFY